MTPAWDADNSSKQEEAIFQNIPQSRSPKGMTRVHNAWRNWNHGAPTTPCAKSRICVDTNWALPQFSDKPLQESASEQTKMTNRTNESQLDPKNAFQYVFETSKRHWALTIEGFATLGPLLPEKAADQTYTENEVVSNSWTIAIRV